MTSKADPIFESVTAPGMPFEISVTDGMRRFVNAPANLDLLVETARRYGSAECIVEDGVRITFEELFDRRDALAAMLDVSKGDRVAICMRNRAEWMVAFLAVIRASGVAALVNSRGASELLLQAIGDVSPALVLADAERADLLKAAGYEGRIIVADQFPTGGEGFAAPVSIAEPDDPAAILFSSGTTGRMKGVVLTHDNLIHGVMGIQLTGTMVLHNAARDLDMVVDDILEAMPQHCSLLVVPLFHISGLGAGFLSPLLAGSKIVIMRRWSGEAALAAIEAERVTMFSGVPTMMWDIVNAAEQTGADLSSLRNLATGGQAMPVNLLGLLRELCPQAVFGTGYGMTETSGSVAVGVGADFLRNRASAGRVLSLVDIRVEDPDGKELPPGEAGEIVIRGPVVMSHYWQQPEATAAALDPDGWYRSGDIGYVDEEGYIFIIDRMKDMVISGGENIYCAEVERVMCEMPQVTECATFGIPDERLGEVLVAQVVAQGLTPEQIIDTVGARLARYKAPVDVRFAETPLPRNDAGKIDKRALREGWIERTRAQ